MANKPQGFLLMVKQTHGEHVRPAWNSRNDDCRCHRIAGIRNHLAKLEPGSYWRVSLHANTTDSGHCSGYSSPWNCHCWLWLHEIEVKVKRLTTPRVNRFGGYIKNLELGWVLF